MIEKDKLHEAMRKMGRKHVKPLYRADWSPHRPTTGYCYVVSEVYYHYCAPEGSQPYMLRITQDETHWFVKHPDGTIVDLTAYQFDKPLPYERAQPRSFMTKKISKRGQILAELLGLTHEE